MLIGTRNPSSGTVVRRGQTTSAERGNRNPSLATLVCRKSATPSEQQRHVFSFVKYCGAQRRRDYMERDSIRSDSKLFIGLFVAFVAPAAGILAWAFFSGYLDQLAQGYKRF